MKRYLIWTGMLNLFWEIGQLPLYTIWAQSTTPEIVFAVVHCTAGDVLIAFFSLLAAVVVVGKQTWPARRFRVVAIVTIFLGIAYTVFSEWNNTVVTRSWAYASAMPQLWGIGLSPVAQWIVVPVLSFWLLCRVQRA